MNGVFYAGAARNVLVKGSVEFKAISIKNSIVGRGYEYRAKKQ